MAHILAIEDHPDHLTLITSWIKALGHSAVAASHADEGLRLIDEHQPDLVLCDIRLGASSGYDVVRSLKSQAATRQLPVVAVTAYSAEEEAMAAGFDGYLSKPMTPEGFRAELERALPALKQAPPPEQLPHAENGPWRKPEPNRTGKRILVLDNTEANRDLMQVILGYGGHDVTCVATIAEALASARSSRPDLILCDMNLDRGRRGVEALRAIQNDPQLRDLRFAFTSATRGSSIEDAMLQQGAYGFLRLPMEPKALLREISKLLA